MLLYIPLLHKLETTQVGPGINIFCDNSNGIKMAGNTYSLNMTMCWVLSPFSFILYLYLKVNKNQLYGENGSHFSIDN